MLLLQRCSFGESSGAGPAWPFPRLSLPRSGEGRHSLSVRRGMPVATLISFPPQESLRSNSDPCAPVVNEEVEALGS